MPARAAAAAALAARRANFRRAFSAAARAI
jgi:hypothetical protein